MKARPYQRECIAACREAFDRHDAAMMVLATGLGKTVIFSHLCAAWPGRIMVMAHRRELVDQAADKIHQITGEEPGIEMGADRVERTLRGEPRIVVSSVQTLSRGRMARFRPDEFSLLVIDECHHSVANSYRAVVDHFRQNAACKVLGATATPRRADDLAMGQVFDHCAFDYGIEPAINDGWLVPVHQRAIKVEGLDFSNVRATAGDLNELDLERVLVEEKQLHAIAAPTVELAAGRPALVFCVTVDHAKALAAVLDRYRPGAVAWLSGESGGEHRRQTIDRYKRGELQFLCNCGLFLEGFDAPSTALIVMARPTKSLSLYMQVLGRGTRVLPGVIDPYSEAAAEVRRAAIAASAKPHMLILDFVGNSGRHKIVTAADVLGGRLGEPVRAQAKLIAEEEADEGRAIPVADALERAQDELALIADQEDWRRRVKAKKAEYHAEAVSPFSGGGSATATEPPFVPATNAQVWKLSTLGFDRDAARKLSKRAASAVIGRLLQEQGLP